MWIEVETHLATELAPHFLIEETLIAPFLETAGESELTKRLFEERELFEVAQERLSPEALGAVAEACRAKRT